MKPGLYPDMTAEQYHADPCPEPSLSNSIAHLLLTRSPKHAWFAHPKLNEDFAPEEASSEMDFGSAVHRLVLDGTEDGIAVIEADSYRTNEAKQQRAKARLVDHIPLLRPKFETAQIVAAAVREQLAASELGPSLYGAAPALTEVAVLWREQERWLRSRLDCITSDYRIVVDLKVTQGSADPEAFVRQLVTMGYDTQSAFYRRGVKAVTGGIDPTFVFVVVEAEPPYMLSLVGLDPGWTIAAEKQVQRAIELWTQCLAQNRWPGYPTRVCWAELPAWREAQMMARELG